MSHEVLHREYAAKASSDRAFGLVFASFFGAIGAWPLLHGGGLRSWALAVAACLAVLSFAAPGLLSVPNRLWTKLGELMARVVGPLACAILFFVCFVPLGWLMRRCGKDPLRLVRDPAARTYWIPRSPPGPEPGSLTRQF
jgi:hypothetical protein